MQIEIAEPASLVERLRMSLVGSFRVEPTLVVEEQLLHGAVDAGMGLRFQSRMLGLLRQEPTITDAEQSALLPLGGEAWSRARLLVRSHFEAPTAIPEHDLAVYTPEGQRFEERGRRSLLDQVDQVARLVADSEVATEPTADLAPFSKPEPSPSPKPAAAKQRPEQAEAPLAQVPVRGRIIAEVAARPAVWEPEIEDEETEGQPFAALDIRELTALPLLAAALEAIGLDEEAYGFLLRYGSYAPAGRKSKITVGGLGLAEFSRRASAWLAALGATKFPIQVVDEGSGELTVFLLEGGPA